MIDEMPGIDGIDHKVVAVEHTVEALTELFRPKEDVGESAAVRTCLNWRTKGPGTSRSPLSSGPRRRTSQNARSNGRFGYHECAGEGDVYAADR